MMNGFGILVVNRAGGNAIRVAPQCVMMDSGAQSVMIDKMLAHKLWLTSDGMAPSPLAT